MSLKETIVHRWLRAPFILHSSVRRVKNPYATVVFIHGIGSSQTAWREVVRHVPDNCSVITVDLLGFGQSPKPDWAIYNARLQARSIMTTLLRQRPAGRLIIVGHSLGALIAVEIAKKYPLLVKSLVLCSPPFYDDAETKRHFPRSDKLLKDLFRLVQRHPEQFVKISALAVKYRLVNQAFSVNHDDLYAYMGTLEASIINQTSLEDAKKLNKPITIIYGSLDPVVVKRNLRQITKVNGNARLVTILAGHDIQGRFIPAITESINLAVTEKKHKTPLQK